MGLGKGAMVGGSVSFVGESFVGDGGVFGTRGGDDTLGGGMFGGSYVTPLLKVTTLVFSLQFSLVWEGSLPVFCASSLLNEVSICPLMFSRFLT